MVDVVAARLFGRGCCSGCVWGVSGFYCGCGCDVLGVENGGEGEGETGGFGHGTRKSRISVCLTIVILSRCPTVCRVLDLDILL